MWSSSNSLVRPPIAPLTEATSTKTSVQPLPASKARSTASNCPLMRRTRPMSFDLCFMVCDMPHNIGGYPISVNTIERIKSVQGHFGSSRPRRRGPLGPAERTLSTSACEFEKCQYLPDNEGVDRNDPV